MDLTRRNFIKLGISVTAGASLIPFVKGCAGLTKTRENVDKIQWDANPAIPIPRNGCYVGWQCDMVQTYHSAGREELLRRLKQIDAAYVQTFLNYHQLKGNCLPAVWSFFNLHIEGDWFPHEICSALHDLGVIPLIRFFPTYDFRGLATGKLDDELKRFATSIIQFGKPIIFVPWPMVNRVYSPKGTIYSKDRTDPVAAKAAWTHLHEIFRSAGANQYAVWGLHVLPLGGQQSLNEFKLDPKLFDWVGFAMYTLKCLFQENFLLNVTDAYEWVEMNYPSKPVAIFEMGRVDTDGQSNWITNAYKIIKRLPRIKMAIYSEYESAGFGAGCGGTLISEKAKAKYKEAVADPYFIKGGQQVKKVLNSKL